MHRCEEHGLGFDGDGIPLDPYEVNERLELLTHLPELKPSSSSSDADEPNPFVDLDRFRWWTYAYLGRYARISPSEVDRLTMRELLALVDALGECLKAESPQQTTFHEG